MALAHSDVSFVLTDTMRYVASLLLCANKTRGSTTCSMGSLLQFQSTPSGTPILFLSCRQFPFPISVCLWTCCTKFEFLALRGEEALHIRRHTTLYGTLRDVFGCEFSQGLKEVDFAKGGLRLSGFLSRSPTCTSSKVSTHFFHFLGLEACISKVDWILHVSLAGLTLWFVLCRQHNICVSMNFYC